MDREVAASTNNSQRQRPYASGHLMCRTSLWGLAGFLGCAYFAWISFSRVAHGDYAWPHDAWTAATYVVWIVLLGIMLVDAHCLRERFFFGVLVINFLIGFGLTVWSSIPIEDVRKARLGTGALWALAAILSLRTLGRAKSIQQ